MLQDADMILVDKLSDDYNILNDLEVLPPPMITQPPAPEETKEIEPVRI